MLNLDENVIKINGDESFLFKILEISDEKIKPFEIIDIFIKNKKQIRSVIKYIENNKTNIDIDRMVKFLNYKMMNLNDSNSKTFLCLMYGDEIGNEKFKNNQKQFSKYYDKNYYINLGFTEEEALEKIFSYKTKKSTTKINFIKKYGEKEGIQKYDDYVNKSKNTIENFKIRYGSEWLEKWENYIKKDSSSLSWALKKSNGDVEKSKQIFDEKNKKTTINLNFFKKKYGDNIYIEKYIENNLKKDNSSLNYFLKKYDDLEKSLKEYKIKNQKKDSNSLDFFKKKYDENGELLYKEKCKLSDNKSLGYFIKKENDYEKGFKKYQETKEKLFVKILKASKSSLRHFKPLYDFLIENNYDDVYLGVENNKEYFIKDKKNIYFYDFTLKNKKIIIEYNGSYWHPNWEKHEINESIKKFKNKIVDPIKVINKDKEKINIAINNGFEVLILWEEDGFYFNEEKLKNFLNKKGINYENKKNY